MANEWDRVRAQKRGGGQTHAPLDTEFAERKFQTEFMAEEISPDRAYERRWALTLLEQTMARLRAEFKQSGKIHEFERLKIFLTADKREIPYTTMANELKMNENALRVAVHRLRKRYRELFREEIAHTLAEGEDIDTELRYLLTVLSA